MSTVQCSLCEGFFPKGWDIKKIDECYKKGVAREDFWNESFSPVECENINDFDTLMGHEIAMQIKLAKDEGKKLAMILPVGPMGMYKWLVYFLTYWKVDCKHVYTFNMDEWSDSEGNTLDSSIPASFEYSMKQAFFNRLGDLTIPESQRNLATADYAIGGCNGALGRGMGWQGMSFLTPLHYGPDTHITSTYIPTLPGRLFYLSELAGPLVAECN